MSFLVGAKIIEFSNNVQYQSYIKVQCLDGSFYLITVSNSKKFILSEVMSEDIHKTIKNIEKQ